MGVSSLLSGENLRQADIWPNNFRLEVIRWESEANRTTRQQDQACQSRARRLAVRSRGPDRENQSPKPSLPDGHSSDTLRSYRGKRKIAGGITRATISKSR